MTWLLLVINFKRVMSQDENSTPQEDPKTKHEEEETKIDPLAAPQKSII